MKHADEFWFDCGPLSAIPPRGARIVKRNSHITVGVSDGKKD